ncbi:MAG: ribonuclease PH [Candidatus Margulisiibacteriota bacterium]|jgi:ribonuclease PH
MRIDNRKVDELRPFEFIRNYTRFAPGSVLVTFGNTKVLCTASIEDKVPPFLRDRGKGWLTAEYCLLPSATPQRNQRESQKGKLSGRTHEIQRLIGRSLRSIIDLDLIGERTIYIDTDVIQADGGTRTAAITGGMIALTDAVNYLLKNKIIKKNPIKEYLAAISVGIWQGTPILDLNYEEDSNSEVDMNVVLTENNNFVEIQGTAEGKSFSGDELNQLLELARKGIREILEKIKDKKN